MSTKKIFVLIGSRKTEGNTAKFARYITKKLEDSYSVEFGFPQDFRLNAIDGNIMYFTDTSYNATDDLKTLQDKILTADALIVGSPVYVHSMAADLKLIIENLAWWAHTLRLQGKPTVVLSTCGSNGFDTVIKPLSSILTFMGGNVIATANASSDPNQINNEEWLDEVAGIIAERIENHMSLGADSNEKLEQVFQGSKANILEQKSAQVELEMEVGELGELKFWEDTGMIHFDTFKEYLTHKKLRRDK